MPEATGQKASILFLKRERLRHPAPNWLAPMRLAPSGGGHWGYTARRLWWLHLGAGYDKARASRAPRRGYHSTISNVRYLQRALVAAPSRASSQERADNQHSEPKNGRCVS